MEAHRIGVISDTHGLLRPEVVDVLKSCEAILHAGDIDKAEVLEQLKTIAPLYAVRGNADKSWAEGLPGGLPEETEFLLYGFWIYMIHNKKDIRSDLRGKDIAVYGHSHKYEDIYDSVTGVRYLNPGSCGPKRFRLPATMMVLNLYQEEHRIDVERIECMSAAASGGRTQQADSAGNGLSEKDMYRLVKEVTKAVRAGRSIADIAARNQADERLVEDICRMYVTHPGIDTDGIMDRLERRGL